MTHPPDVVSRSLALLAAGWRPAAVARELHVPRRTVAGWSAGRTPDRAAASLAEPRDLPISYAYLLGLYLGDGCLSSHPRGVFKLRITLDVRYPGIVAECETAMAEAMPASRVARRRTIDNCFEVYSYSKRWPVLFPQHGPGKKHLRPIVLECWQREHVDRAPHLLLRGLIHSDGCRFITPVATGAAPDTRSPTARLTSSASSATPAICSAFDGRRRRTRSMSRGRRT